jgi:hypothetical protein
MAFSVLRVRAGLIIFKHGDDGLVRRCDEVKCMVFQRFSCKFQSFDKDYIMADQFGHSEQSRNDGSGDDIKYQHNIV